jgi:GxxExxY protein
MSITNNSNRANNANKSKKRVGEKVLYPELSYRVMNAVFEVHNQLGPGFTENIYERALILEFDKRGIAYKAQKQIEIIYKGEKLGNYRLDLLVEGCIILELKAVIALNDLFKHQLLSYLRATDLKLGILVNFGAKRVEYIRITN